VARAVVSKIISILKFIVILILFSLPWTEVMVWISVDPEANLEVELALELGCLQYRVKPRVEPGVKLIIRLWEARHCLACCLQKTREKIGGAR